MNRKMFLATASLLVVAIAVFVYVLDRNTSSHASIPSRSDHESSQARQIPAAPASTTAETTSTHAPTLVNPASAHCVAVGGTLVMKTRGDGGQYGLCMFDDNRGCEEWSLMRGDCPLGGRKTTGYNTEAERYCAWLGGETYAVDNAVCKFKNGVTCSDDALFAGTCTK